MKREIALSVLAALLGSGPVRAQERITPPVCYQRCTRLAFEDHELTQEWFFAKLRKIQAQKKAETAPLRRKEFDVAGQDEIERLKEQLEKVCRKTCKFEG